jgi:glycosyltransferase involved in cell wall biosynthesis
MRILFFIPYTSSNYGGTSIVAKSLAREIKNYDISIDLISTNASGNEKLDVPLEQWIENGSYRTQYFSCWHRNDLIVSNSLLKWLKRNIHSYDVVHTHTIWSPLVSSIQRICRSKGKPYISTPHGMLEPWILSSKSWKKKPYLKLVEQPALQKAAYIQAIAPEEERTIRKLGFKNVITAPNGINRKDFEFLQSPEIFYEQFPETRGKKIILFLGRLHPKKGLDLLAPAFSRIHHSFPDTHLVIAGPDNSNFLETAKGYFSDVNCLNSVTFTGLLNGDLKYSALAASTLYVAPSYSEGFSMSILEGMASGLPCVITNTCNFPEASHVAYIVNVDTEHIYKAMFSILNDKEGSKELGNQARDFIFKNYTWELSAKKLINCYESIITKSLEYELTPIH